MSGNSSIGSDAWREHVFCTPSLLVRKPESRTTVRSIPKFDGERSVIEGANDLLTAYFLSYFKSTCEVIRWKHSPFEWLLTRDARPSIPRFLVELAPDKQLLVIQTKQQRYLTALVRARFEEERALAKSAGIEHIVWTDSDPLTAAARETLFRIRGARNAPHDPVSLDSLVAFVAKNGMPTLSEIVDAGLDPSLVPIGVHQNKLHVSLSARLEGQSVVTTHRQTCGRDFLLLRGFSPDAWWRSLDAA